MEIIRTKDTNHTYAENQPQYRPLPCHKMTDGLVVSTWKLSEEELEEVKRTGVVHLAQVTFNGPLQPVMLASKVSEIYNFGYLEVIKTYVQNIKAQVEDVKSLDHEAYQRRVNQVMDVGSFAVSKQSTLDGFRKMLESYAIDIAFVQSKMYGNGEQPGS